MPRRIPDYPDAYYGWNFVSSIGSMITVIATVIFVVIIYKLFTNNNTLISEIKQEEGHDIINKNTWIDAPFFVSQETLFANTPFANTLDYAVSSPIPTHVFNNLPVLGENELETSNIISTTKSESKQSKKNKNV